MKRDSSQAWVWVKSKQIIAGCKVDDGEMPDLKRIGQQRQPCKKRDGYMYKNNN